VSKSLIKYLSSIPGKLEIKENYKKGHIGHSTHTWGNANVEVQNIQHGK